MKKIFPILFLSSILLLPGCLFEKSPSVFPNEIPNKTENGESPFSDDEGSQQQEPQTSSGEISGANIIVESPKPSELVSSPFEIRGRARVFENMVNVDVKKEDGTVVISEVMLVRGNEAGEYGDFSLNLGFQFTSTRKGTIELYSLSPKDGSKENLVVIPVEFKTLDQN